MAHPTGNARHRAAGDVAAWLAAYQPRTTSESRWSEVRPFVLLCVGRLQPTGFATAARTTRLVTRIALWAAGEGIALDVEAVFDPATVERFTATELAAERSKATYRSTLRGVGRQLTRHAGWEPPPPAAGRRQVARPYTEVELAGLRRDAEHQPTPVRRRAARALLALGAGAGLDGRWLANIAASDVSSDQFGVVVRVGPPNPRIVPVLARWEAELSDLAATARGEQLVGGRSTSRNRVGNLSAQLQVAHGHPRFSASRLRSTWLATHLAAGTRLPELARAAGLQGVTVLSDLLAHIAPLDDTAARRILRGRP